MSIESVTRPVRPASTMAMAGELYLCDEAGEEIEDLTDAVVEGYVEWDFQGTIKGSLRATLKSPVQVRPYADCLKAVQVIKWHDAQGKRHSIRESVGLFYFPFPDQDVDETVTINHIDAVDVLWKLDGLTTDALLWLPKGADYGAEARKLFAGKTGAIRLDLPNTSLTLQEPRTVLPNARILRTANELYQSADYWDLAADRHGEVSTFQRQVLGASTAKRVILSEDVLGTIRKQPDRENFCNQVFLSSNSPEADLTLRDGYKVSFVDPDSPWSVDKIGVWPAELADTRSESFETMRRRAITMLETAAGTQERILVPVWPDPRFDPREPWEMTVDQHNGTEVARGMYRLEKTTFGFTPDSLAQVATLSHLVNTDWFFEEGLR